MVWKSIGVVSPVKHGRSMAHRAMLTTYSAHVLKYQVVQFAGKVTSWGIPTQALVCGGMHSSGTMNCVTAGSGSPFYTHAMHVNVHTHAHNDMVYIHNSTQTTQAALGLFSTMAACLLTHTCTGMHQLMTEDLSPT